MKLAFVHQPLGTLPVPATMGSIEVLVYELGRRLARSNEVTAYSRKSPNQSFSDFQERVRYKRVTTRLDDIFESHQKLKRLPPFRNPSRPLFASGIRHLEYGLKLAADIRRERFDWIHIYNFSQLIPIIRKFNPQLRIALHMECEWATQLDPGLIRRRLDKCNLIMGCSDFITDKIREVFPELGVRCRTVFNGVDINHFVPNRKHNRPGTQAARLLFVGRIWPDKGPHVLLEAFRKVVETNPQVEIELVGWRTGPPPEFELLLTNDKKVTELEPLFKGNYFDYLHDILPPKLWHHVSVQDALPHEELAKRYQMADIFIAPSVWHEPFGMVIVEAMASGLPVISTRSGGIPEIVRHRETGLLTERGDSDDLAKAITTLLNDDRLRQSMACEGRKRAVEFFSWDKIAQDLTNLYHTFT